jgi:hypothetical protein
MLCVTLKALEMVFPPIMCGVGTLGCLLLRETGRMDRRLQEHCGDPCACVILRRQF